jgi:hypothetical protein
MKTNAVYKCPHSGTWARVPYARFWRGPAPRSPPDLRFAGRYREICSHFVDSQHCRTTRVGLAANGSLLAAYPGSPVTAVGRDLPEGPLRSCRSVGIYRANCCGARQGGFMHPYETLTVPESGQSESNSATLG